MQVTPRPRISLLPLIVVIVASVACWAGLAVAVYVLLRIFVVKH